MRSRVRAWTRKATAAGRNGKGPGETAGGSAGGLLDRQDLTITKSVDLATPKLMEILAKGSHIKTAVLSLCERTSNTTVEYLRITMTDVLVPSMNTGGDCVSGRPIDTLTLTFAKISVQYTRQSSTGAGLSVNFNWDFGANRGF